jgi:transcriptional regulator GlxA family with amidase domain
LLRAGARSIAEIAVAVGYETEPSFRKAFRRWMGRSPGEYRRNRASDSEGASRAQ